MATVLLTIVCVIVASTAAVSAKACFANGSDGPGRGLGWIAALAAAFAVWGVADVARAHEPYSAWKDGRGYSCCNEADCRPTRADRDAAGGWRVWVDGRWVSVPADALLPIPSPDGRSHVCITPGALEPRCFVPGEVRG